LPSKVVALTAVRYTQKEFNGQHFLELPFFSARDQLVIVRYYTYTIKQTVKYIVFWHNIVLGFVLSKDYLNNIIHIIYNTYERHRDEKTTAQINDRDRSEITVVHIHNNNITFVYRLQARRCGRAGINWHDWAFVGYPYLYIRATNVARNKKNDTAV